MLKPLVAVLMLAAAPQDRLSPVLDRWRSGTEENRLEALRDAASLRRELGDLPLGAFAEPPVPGTWTRAAELMDIVSRERIVSWYAFLVPLLASPNAQVRGRAAEELGRRELRRYSGAVVPLLADRESRVAWQAAFTLVLMDARDRVPEAAPLLKDPGASVRLNVLHVLARLGAREHGPLLAPMLDDPDPDVAIAAVEALGGLKAVEFSDRIVRFLDAPEPMHRQAAIVALARMGAKNTAHQIAERLSDGQTLVRWEAIRALGRLKAWDHAGDIVSMAEDDGAQAPVLEALGEFGLRELAPHIIPFLETPEPGIRWRAVKALGSVDAKDDAKRIALMLKDPDSYVRLCALQALAAVGASEQAGEMLALLSDEEADVCKGAAEETSALVTPGLLKRVVPLLRAEDPFIRWSALFLLVEAEARELLPEILPGLRSGSAFDRDVVRAVGRLGGREQRGILVEALRSTDGLVRVQAAFGLARIGDRTEELEAAERSSQGAPKLAAGFALVRLGRKDRASGGALLREFLMMQDEPDYQGVPDEILDALAAGYEKDLARVLSKEVDASKRVESVKDLRTLLARAGLVLAPDDALELRRRLPGGSKLTARRALEWSFGRPLHLVPGGGQIRMLDTARALEAWQKRLDAP